MIERLEGVLKSYDWGDPVFLADFQLRSPTGQPEAELWFGAHLSAPSMLDTGVPLDEAIAGSPVTMLGEATYARFGQLPFLTKILAASRPLSLQAHPSTAEAQAGFDRENALGIPIDSSIRNFQDRSHKPELLCALTKFEAKVGFRSVAASDELFTSLTSSRIKPIVQRLRSSSSSEEEVLMDLLTWLLRLDPVEATGLVIDTVEAANRVPEGGPFSADLAWTGRLSTVFPGQIGVVVALLLNHVYLEPSDAIFLGSGNLHIYLQGAGVEIMANSNNVIRAGLTSKHVDVDELLRVVDCSPVLPKVQAATAPVHIYDTPVPEFTVSRIDRPSALLRVSGPEILIVTDGTTDLHSAGGEPLQLSTGQAVWVPADRGSYAVHGAATLYRVTVGEVP